MRITDVPDPEDDPKPTSPEVGDQLWAFIPIIVGVAAVCLLIFFFVSPSFRSHRQHGRKEHSARSRNGDHKA
jgi:hypothetical protein